MFFHLFKYKILDIVRSKEDFFWGAFFPIVLATLFYFGFGNLMNGNDVKFNAFPIAVVEEEENKIFSEVLDELSKDDEDAMFKVTKTDKTKALELLENGEVDGIITVSKDPETTINKSGFNQTILLSFMKQYTAQSAVITDIATNHPERLAKAVDNISSEVDYNKEITLGNGQFDSYIQYFYALIAMACVYCASTGVRVVCSFQANMSELGKRREVAPTHKLLSIIADFCAAVFMQWIYDLILIAYLLLLGIDIGTRLPLVIVTIFTGSIIGIALGFFIGALSKASYNVKTSIATAITMTLSFLSGLMIHTIKDVIEHTCPIINRLNPATLITDALYALNMYTDYSRFITNIVTMLVTAVLLCLGSYLLLRRNTYANL